jgi:hypothetical protein
MLHYYPLLRSFLVISNSSTRLFKRDVNPSILLQPLLQFCGNVSYAWAQEHPSHGRITNNALYALLDGTAPLGKDHSVASTFVDYERNVPIGTLP